MFKAKSDKNCFGRNSHRIPVIVGIPLLCVEKSCATIFGILCQAEHRKKGYGTDMTCFLTEFFTFFCKKKHWPTTYQMLEVVRDVHQYECLGAVQKLRRKKNLPPPSFV